MAVMLALVSYFSHVVDTLATGLPSLYFSLLTLLVFSLMVVLYTVLTWKFHKLLAKKDFFKLNLAQYNKTAHVFYNKLVAVLLYFLEYIIIVPIVISLGFSVLAVVILLLSNGLATSQIIVVAVAIVGAIRILAYYHEEIAQELSKLLPFNLLVILVTTHGLFSLERLVASLSEVGTLFNQVLYFFLFIICLELVLRILDLLFGD